jgi:hypothetical protein
MDNFMIILDKALAEKYNAKGFKFLHEKKIGGQTGYVFSTKGQKLVFDNNDEKKISFTNRLTF